MTDGDEMEETESYKSYLKSEYGSIKHSTYFHSYDHFFSQYRGKSITFVEIGVLGGGSLFMWRDYFGPNARIIGVDFNPNAKKWEKYGFEIYIGNQADIEFWSEFRKAVGEIDIVLDDGGHTYEQQIVTTEALLESLSDGGVLVVEDTHTSYMHGFGPKNRSFIKYVVNRIDAVNRRFSSLDDGNSERRFWSLEIVESMVAFKVRRKEASLESYATTNNGITDGAKDYRNQNIPGYETFSRYSNLIKILKRVTVLLMFFRMARAITLSVKFSASKYFK